MRLEFVLMVFTVSKWKVSTQEVYGSECNPPIRCVNSTVFAFCTIIGDEEKLLGHQHCLEGQKCSESGNFYPCTSEVTVSHTTPTKATQTTKTPTVSPPNCEKTGPGNYPAPKCNQYYTCSKTLWWWDAKLKTCPKKNAFDQTLQKCVPSEQTSCILKR